MLADKRGIKREYKRKICVQVNLQVTTPTGISSSQKLSKTEKTNREKDFCQGRETVHRVLCSHARLQATSSLPIRPTRTLHKNYKSGEFIQMTLKNYYVMLISAY